MPFQPSFGVLSDAQAAEAPAADSPFRIAILGDFTGRGHHGDDVDVDALAGRKPIKINRANFDDMMAAAKPKVKIPDLKGEALEHTFASLDDFHPDQIHEKVDQFAFVSDEDDKAALMAAFLHHPHLQAVESAWRGVDWLLRRALKAENKVEVVLYDISLDELRAAINVSEDLSESPIYQILIEQGMRGPKGQPWALWLGLYQFDLTGPDAQALGRLAKIARQAGAPFLSDASSRVLEPSFALDGDAKSAWTALRQLPEAALVGLATPRILLRLPYGENTQSVERFSFEEFKHFDGKKGYLWGNAALACAALMTQSFLKDGWGFKPGSILDLDGMHLHAYVEDDEEASTLAEAWITRTMVEKFVKLGLMPIMSVKGRNAMQLSRFLSLAQPPKDQPASELLGRWGQAGMSALPRSSAKPPLSVSLQFAPAANAPAKGAAPASAPAPAAGKPAAAAAAPEPAEEEAPAAPPPEEALDPELAALMAQFDSPAPAAEPAPPPAPPPQEEALDPELAALMAQFDAPAAAHEEAAPAAPAEEEVIDPELAALMKQLEGGNEES